MLLAILILLLALLGVIPFTVAVPLCLGSIVIGSSMLGLLQRRLSRMPIRTGSEAMVGSIAPALTCIDRDGQIRFGSEIWNARSDGPPIPAGARVRIVRIEGLRALVAPADSDGR